MSVNVPIYDFQTKTKSDARHLSLWFCSHLRRAGRPLWTRWRKVFQKMLQAGADRKIRQLMAEEIEKTRRRVNALEYVMIPNTQEAIRYITMKLDENDRATTTRLMKVKDMLLKEAIEEQRARDEAAMSRFTAQET